jgi:diguanylate cyclase (GGDEF)-like protein
LLGLQAELQDLSFKDALTGLSNRRRFDHVLEREWADARSNRQPLSLVMIDIDYFKQYNDLYGHLQGDSCLKMVADLLFAASKRSRDFLARFGGEEFALVLPDTDAEAARKVAWRCRDAIARARIPHAGSAIGENLTISLGVDTMIPGDGDESKLFLAIADRRLYLAKQQGRDRIVTEG